jgi:hypothetical protein
MGLIVCITLSPTLKDKFSRNDCPFFSCSEGTFCPGIHCFLPPRSTCSALNDDDELDAVGLVERASSLLVEVGVPEVPAQRVQ